MATSIRQKSPSLEKKSKKIKVSAFHKAPDKYSFSHLAKILTSGERLAMLSAVDRLKGRVRVLIELALFSSFPFVRLAAISNLSHDVEALIDIAKFCQHEDTRASAVDELSHDPDALAEIACSSLFGGTRLAAVHNLSNPDSLAEIASRSPNKDSRSAAVEKIANNPAALKKVAENSPYRNVRMQVINLLSSNIDTLCSLVLSKHNQVKKAAVSKLSLSVEEIEDTEALIQIAKFSQNEDSRYISVGRLSNDPLSLKAVISDSEYTDSRSTALMLLSDMVKKLHDPELLSDVAILSPYADCRSAAIDRLVGQNSALLSVAAKSKFRNSRDQALHKLKGDVEALKSLSKLSRYPDTRKKAHHLVSKPDVFENELVRILG